MDMFQHYILPYLEDGYIRYLADGVVKAMSAEYFQKSFNLIASTDLPNIGHSYFFYQSKENPELVMRFRISQTAGLSATILLFNEYEKQRSVLGSI